MSATLTATNSPIPSHVPTELVMPCPLQLGATTLEDPFKTIIPDMHKGPPVYYAPNGWLGAANSWVFCREEDIRRIFMDTEHFSSKDMGPFPTLVGEAWSVLPVEADPPRHRGYRNVLAPLFTPVRVAALESQMRGYVRDYINQFKDAGQCDGMKDLAARFPVAVFLGLFGLPLSEVDQFMAWEFDLLHNSDMQAIANAVRAVKVRLVDAINDRKVNPADDLISHIVQWPHEGRSLTEDEAFGICFNLYLGGLDTVTTNISWQLRHLANDTELQNKLRADPSLIPQAVEEMLRAYAAVGIFRTCVKETQVAGFTIKPGEKVMMSTSLGSNDPRIFDNPMEVRLGRQRRNLGFGTGVHACVGSRLARRELIIAIEEFLTAIPVFRLAPDAKILTHLGGVIQQETVPIVW